MPVISSPRLRSSSRAPRGEVRCTPRAPASAIGCHKLSGPGQVTAVAECAVQLAGFKNVDLFSQGVYQVRVRAHAERSGRAAVPFTIAELPLPPLPGSINTEQLLPAHIQDRTGDVCTHAFRVRYCDEEVALHLLARFRLELRLVAAAEGLECEDVMLEIRLLHARSSTQFVKDGDAETQSLQRFAEVAVQRLRLRLPQPESASFFPCTFDDAHFCYLALTAHVALLEFKLRAATAHAPPSSSPPGALHGSGRTSPSLRMSASASSASLSSGASADGRSRSPSLGFLGALVSPRPRPSPASMRGGGAEAAAEHEALTHLLSLLHTPPGGADQPQASRPEPSEELVAAASVALVAHAAWLVHSDAQLRGEIARLRADVGDTPDGSRAAAAAVREARLAHALQGGLQGGEAGAPATASSGAAGGAAGGAEVAELPPLELPNGLWLIGPSDSTRGDGDVGGGDGGSDGGGGGDGVSLDGVALSLDASGTATSASGGGATATRVAAAPGGGAAARQLLAEAAGAGAEFVARVGWASQGEGGAPPQLLAGAGWAGLGPQAWATKAMGALSALAGQLWRLWQAYIAQVTASAVSAAPLRRHSDLHLQRRGAGCSHLVRRERLRFEQRASREHADSGVGSLGLAAALRESFARERRGGLPRDRLTDEALRRDAAPLLFEQSYTRTGAAPPATATAATLTSTSPSSTAPPPPAAAAPSPAAADAAVAARAPRLTFSWMEPPVAAPAALAGSGPHIHLYVFVHGFHGNAFDLRGIKNQLALLHPHKASARYLLSSCNEEHTGSASFAQLGENLAREIISFMTQEGLLQSARRISFLCHSFGSIIARAALGSPLLREMLPRMHAYLSFSGPHLGMLYFSNPLVELGIWGFRKWKNARCLTELALKDARTANASYLYSLSKGDALRHFRHVLLVSSSEDRYVPHHSARIQLCAEALHDQKHGPAFVSMVHNLLSPLDHSSVLHVDVCFGTPPSLRLAEQLDQAIGRTAHISFLENASFLQMFGQAYLEYFV